VKDVHLLHIKWIHNMYTQPDSDGIIVIASRNFLPQEKWSVQQSNSHCIVAGDSPAQIKQLRNVHVRLTCERMDRLQFYNDTFHEFSWYFNNNCIRIKNLLRCNFCLKDVVCFWIQMRSTFHMQCIKSNWFRFVFLLMIFILISLSHVCLT